MCKPTNKSTSTPSDTSQSRASGTSTTQTSGSGLTSRVGGLAKAMRLLVKLRWQSIRLRLVDGLLHRLMTWRLKLGERFIKILYSINNLQSLKEWSAAQCSPQPSKTEARSALNQPRIPTPLSEKDLTGLSLMKPPSFQSELGSNTSDLLYQTEVGGFYSCQLPEGLTGYMIYTSEGSLLIIPNGNHGNTPVMGHGISGIA